MFIYLFIQSWLKDKTCRWTVVMADCDKWKVTVDLEQILLNWNFGSTAATADLDRKKETMEFGDAGYDRCLEIFQWIRADGVSMTLLYGASRRVLPSKYVDCTSSPEENRSQFVSLWQWLT
jgi:hypothetical protein